MDSIHNHNIPLNYNNKFNENCKRFDNNHCHLISITVYENASCADNKENEDIDNNDKISHSRIRNIIFRDVL